MSTVSLTEIKSSIRAVANLLRYKLSMGTLHVIRHEDVRKPIVKKFGDTIDGDLIDDLIHEELHGPCH